MSTLAELCGATSGVASDIDGLSIVPTLVGETAKQKQHDYLYWAFYERGGAQAARMGRWKAVQQPYHSLVRLYDVAKDVGEEQDVAAVNPEIVAKLSAAMKEAYVPAENWKFPEPAAAAAGKSK